MQETIRRSVKPSNSECSIVVYSGFLIIVFLAFFAFLVFLVCLVLDADFGTSEALDAAEACSESVGLCFFFFLGISGTAGESSELDSESELEESSFESSTFRFFEISSCFIFSESCSNLICALVRSLSFSFARSSPALFPA